MLTSKFQDLKLQNTKIQNDLKSMSRKGGNIGEQIRLTLAKNGIEL